jgi:hypothetical protein
MYVIAVSSVTLAVFDTKVREFCIQVIDLDHPDAPKLVNSILKALEALTRAASMTERAYGSDGVAPKKSTEENTERPAPETVLAETETRADDGAQPQARDETMRDSVPQDTSVPEVGPPIPDNTEVAREEQMEHDDGFDRDPTEEVHVMFLYDRLLYACNAPTIWSGCSTMCR